MRKPRFSARAWALAAAVVTTASVTGAAPAKHKKAVKHAASAAPSVPVPEQKAEEPPESPATAPTPAAPPPEPTPSAPPATPVADPTAAVTERTASAEGPVIAPERARGAEPNSRELEALGRREAARIAAGRSEVAVWAAMGVARRAFKYSDPVGQQYAPYRLPLAPMVDLGLEAYPFASSGLPVLQDLGFRARFSKAFAVDSRTPEGATIDTSWTRFGAEARQRLLLQSAHRLELGIAVGADGSYFDMSTSQVVPALLPSARTISVRVGLDARLEVVRQLGLALGAAYLAPTTRGAIYERFRDPELRGVDADFAAILRVLPGFELRASARYTRYFASFKPALGDHFVAGGALDEQLQFGLGVRYEH